MGTEKGTLIGIQPQVYLLLVLLIFLIPLPWLAAWIGAILLHELCHYGCVQLLGGKVCTVTVGIGTISMESAPMTDGKRILCVLAGPIGGLFPLLIGRWVPRLALCSIALSAYNLLPLLPLDGGRLMEIIFSKYPIFYRLFQKFFMFFLVGVGLYSAFVLNLGIFPLAVIGILYLKHRNTSCKEGTYAVK